VRRLPWGAQWHLAVVAWRLVRLLVRLLVRQPAVAVVLVLV
jgi:hypothetical protein